MAVPAYPEQLVRWRHHMEVGFHAVKEVCVWFPDPVQDGDTDWYQGRGVVTFKLQSCIHPALAKVAIHLVRLKRCEELTLMVFSTKNVVNRMTWNVHTGSLPYLSLISGPYSECSSWRSLQLVNLSENKVINVRVGYTKLNVTDHNKLFAWTHLIISLICFEDLFDIDPHTIPLRIRAYILHHCSH